MLNIMVVDDYIHGLTSLSDALDLNGYTTQKFTDPINALSHYKMQKPDVIITDYTMKQLNGFELAQEISKIDTNANIIVMSGRIDFTCETEPNDLIYACLRKPLDIEKLLNILQEIEQKIKE